MHKGGIKTQAEFKSHLLADTHTQTLRVISDSWSQQ
jgi:ribosomal protein L35